jgi:hypothetical protein
VGRPGSGKSSLAIAFMTQSKPKIYKKTHHKVLVMMPSNSINSMKKNPFAVLPPEKFFNELNETTIQQVYNILEDTAKDMKTLLFIDDCTADLKRSKIVETTLKKIVYNRRHLKCNIIVTSQSYVNLPLDIRKTITSVFMFKPSKKELEILFNELIESKKESFMDIMRFAYDDPHNFLFVNINSQRLFKNFDEIIITEDDDDENEIEIEKK